MISLDSFAKESRNLLCNTEVNHFRFSTFFNAKGKYTIKLVYIPKIVSFEALEASEMAVKVLHFCTCIHSQVNLWSNLVLCWGLCIPTLSWKLANFIHFFINFDSLATISAWRNYTHLGGTCVIDNLNQNTARP